MGDIVGNIGEPLDFVEHQLNDEDGEPDASEDTELEDAVGMSGGTGVAEVEATGSSGGVGNSVHASGTGVGAVLLDIGDIELEEVCFLDFRVSLRSDLRGRWQLRLSTVLPV